MLIRLSALGVIWLATLITLGRMRRSYVTNSLLQKYAEDERHKNECHEYWYQIQLEKIKEELRSKFVQLEEDEETKAFLDNCYQKTDAVFWQLYHSIAIPFLKLFMTQTDVNGYLDRGSMFVFSTTQFDQLLGIDEAWKADSLLDLGAGDGKVAEKMAGHFQHIYTTEISTQMRKQLVKRGFAVLGIDEWTEQKYDIISCLNLLDRCDKPLTLLKQIRESLKEDGRLVIASVSPYSAYVEENKSNGNKPTEWLAIRKTKCVEEQVNQMVENVFIPSGFEVVSFSRLPYLCEGDLTTSFYVLYDILFVLKPTIY